MKFLNEKKLKNWDNITDMYGENVSTGTEVVFTKKIIQSHGISKGIVIDKTEKKLRIIEYLSPELTVKIRNKNIKNIYTKTTFLKLKEKIIKITNYKFYIEAEVEIDDIEKKVNLIFPFNTKEECYNILININGIKELNSFISDYDTELNSIKNNILLKFPSLLI